MKKYMLKKMLVVGIIVLLIGVCVLSSVSSKDISVSTDKLLEDNNEIETADNYVEVFSFISGGGVCLEVGGGLLWQSFDFISGKFYIRGFSINPLGWYNATVGALSIPFFVGTIIDTGASYHDISGIALGNLHWS